MTPPQPQQPICNIVKILYEFCVEEFTSAEEGSDKEMAFMKMLDLFPQSVHARTGKYPDYCSRPHTSSTEALEDNDALTIAYFKGKEDGRNATLDEAIRKLEELKGPEFSKITAQRNATLNEAIESLRSTKEQPE